MQTKHIAIFNIYFTKTTKEKCFLDSQENNCQSFFIESTVFISSVEKIDKNVGLDIRHSGF